MQYVFSVILLALCDRFLKLYIIRNIRLGERVPFIGGILDLTHVENTGAAFGRLQGMRWLLVAISAVAVIVIIALIITRKVRHPFAVWSLILMAGGALGNLADRVLYGRVVDMFMLTFVDFAIFNLADCFIDIGGIALCVYLIFVSGRGGKETKKEGPGSGGDG